MAFNRPSLSDLVTRIQADFVSRLSLAAPLLRRSMVYVISRVLAGAAHMLHGQLEYLSRQIFPDLSDREYLIRQGALYGLSIIPAAFAYGAITFTGTNGTIIHGETTLLRSDGAEFTTYEDVTISSGSAIVLVTASVAGEAGNCAGLSTLTLESPIAGVNSTATVSVDGVVNGSDQETDDAFRSRVVARMQAAPHGGDAADYVAWAREVAGVTRAWCYPLELGAGTVVVRFVRDDDVSIIPDAGEVTAVQTYIDGVRPVTATLTVLAPIGDSLSYTVHLVPDTSDTRAAVEAELQDLIRQLAQPGGTIPISKIRNAIGDAAGVTDYVLSSPSADVVSAAGHMSIHGTMTYT